MLIDTADEESLKARTGAESESKMKKREDEELALAKEKDGKDLSPKELEVLECLWSAKKAKSVPKIVKLLRENRSGICGIHGADISDPDREERLCQKIQGRSELLLRTDHRGERLPYVPAQEIHPRKYAG